MNPPTHKNNFGFFGSSRLSVIVLDRLFALGLVPSFIVTTKDKLVGRKQILTPNVVKQWAISKNITFFTPQKLDTEFTEKIKSFCNETSVASEDGLNNSNTCQVFLVASYGKIIPETIIDIPKNKTLNIHPSLLPKYRGPSPLPTAILEDTKKTGVSIMVLDKEMDHGPIVAQREIEISEWPTYEDFEEMMAKEGADLFAEILPSWIEGKIIPKEQNHEEASYTKKIIKEDGKIDLNDDPYKNFRKIQAYHEWPQAYFFITHRNKELRIKITEANFTDDKLEIQKVIPEGGKEMSYGDFLRGYSS